MINRRRMLHLLGASGFCSAMPKLALAAAPSDNRLVVIILRGAMDGLDVLRPTGDKSFSALRPATDLKNSSELDGFFSLHPAFSGVMPLFKARELAFVHAVATPYRQRSHFDGQDILEAGGMSDGAPDSGWLNRLLSLMGGNSQSIAVDIGSGSDRILDGPNRVRNWYPDVRVDLSLAGSQFLKLLYQDDPLLNSSLAEIEKHSAAAAMDGKGDPGVSPREIAQLASRFLNEDARIAAFSIDGWDTHVGQEQRLGHLLPQLAAAFDALKEGLGKNWARTAVFVCSEFGRTARFNGSGGTDHGTGTMAILGGGLLVGGAGGKVLGEWPGLGEGSLYQDRDLMPTSDVRRYAAWLIEPMFGVGMSGLTSSVFQGLDPGERAKLIG